MPQDKLSSSENTERASHTVVLEPQIPQLAISRTLPYGSSLTLGRRYRNSEETKMSPIIRSLAGHVLVVAGAINGVKYNVSSINDISESDMQHDQSM